MNQPSKPSSRKVIDRHLYVPHYLVVLANGMERGQSRIYLKHFGIGINERESSPSSRIAARSPRRRFPKFW
jgi:hypothetical protein